MHNLKNFLRKLKRKLRTQLNYVTSIDLNGTSVKIPHIYGIKCGMSEPWMNDVLAPLLATQRGAFIDVGVNVGQTLVKVKTLDACRNYIGFEPNSSCVFYLRELIKSNNYTKCLILPIGISNSAALLGLDLYTEDETDSCASLVPYFRPEQTAFKKIHVPTYDCRHFEKLFDTDSIGIVKIDVEGGELEVLLGLKSVLEKHLPIVLLEILPVYEKENTFRLDRQEQIEKLFKDLGYSLYRIDKDGDSFTGITAIDNVGIHGDLDACDYLASYQESSIAGLLPS